MNLQASFAVDFFDDFSRDDAASAAVVAAVLGPMPQCSGSSGQRPALAVVADAVPGAGLRGGTGTAPAVRVGKRPAAAPFFIAAPEALHPALWRASQLGAGRGAVSASGFAALDAELPGGGWPHGVLTELLLAHPGLGEMRLLAPALAAISRGPARPPGRTAAPAGVADASAAARPTSAAAAGRCVMLFDPPAALCGGALAQLGVDTRQWLVVHGRAAPGRSPGPAQRAAPQDACGAAFPRGRALAREPLDVLAAARLRQRLPATDLWTFDLLWALEQALESGQVGALLAWLPVRLPTDALRRLQLAAQAHDGPVFVLRGVAAQARPSAAPLRLALQPGGIDEIALRLLKRRGPPLAQVLRLALPPVLGARLRERALARLAACAAASPRGAKAAEAAARAAAGRRRVGV